MDKKPSRIRLNSISAMRFKVRHLKILADAPEEKLLEITLRLIKLYKNMPRLFLSSANSQSQAVWTI